MHRRERSQQPTSARLIFETKYTATTLTALLLITATQTSPGQAQVTPPGSGVISPISTAAEQAAGNFVTAPIRLALANGEISNAEIRLPLPQIVRWPQVPTDVTGVGGSLGHAQNLRHRILGSDRNTLPASRGLVIARDPLYLFTAQWQPISQTTLVGQNLGIIQQRAVIASASEAVPVFMPTENADFRWCDGDRLMLKSGALLLRSGARPARVAMPLACNQAVTVEMARGSIAMVSNFNGNITIVNLRDSRRNGLFVSMNDSTNGISGTMALRTGYMAEIYPSASRLPVNEPVAYTILSRNQFSNGYSVETTRFNYPLLLKRFNIARSIDTTTMRSIWKTAAAVSYIDREREWNGLTPTAL